MFFRLTRKLWSLDSALFNLLVFPNFHGYTDEAVVYLAGRIRRGKKMK